MAFELKQEQSLKLSQQLVMTPQLLQAIKLLPLCRLEMIQVIRQEIDENPVLDIDEDLEFSEIISGESNGEYGAENTEKPERLKVEESPEEFDWKGYIENISSDYSGTFDGIEREPFESTIVKQTTLSDHLLWQLHLSTFTEEEMAIGISIIGNLDQDGYLKATLTEIAGACQVNEEAVERVLKRVQEFDPIGVGSRDLKECLLIQARCLLKDVPLVEEILNHHLPDLERKKYQVIARELRVSLREVIKASKLISELEPKPGRSFSTQETEYITPDIYVYKVNDEYVVVLNEDGLPKLRISPLYRKAIRQQITGIPREYIQGKLRSALWLIKGIYHRQRTIKNVMKSIIKFQREFFDKGIGHLKPLILKDVADDIQMHESTISRVTTNKYVHTPHGIFELKYFFNSRISSVTGEDIASESVKDKIRQILAKEDDRKPYSDQEIVKILKEDNIEIARRTVAKYRESLGILSSSKRKKLF
jgi:RNA polymerase sigma-54 factor